MLPCCIHCYQNVILFQVSDIQTNKLLKKIFTKHATTNINQTYAYVLDELGVKQGDLLMSLIQSAREKREAPSDATTKTMNNIIIDFITKG